MIFGIGIDLIEVPRVAQRVLSENGFREKVFSTAEIAYCEARGEHRAQHYAARFSAKEAFLKATGHGMNLTFDLNKIEVRIKEQGNPEIHLIDELSLLPKQYGWTKIHVSLTHLAETAAAVVVIETGDSK